MTKKKIALYQMCSSLSFKKNIEKIEAHCLEWARLKVDWVFLPENFYSMGLSPKSSPELLQEEQAVNSSLNPLSILAKKYQIGFMGGSALTQLKSTALPVNRAFFISKQGEILGHYDKIHLFSFQAQDAHYHEDKKVTPGSAPKVLLVDDWKIGASICFDLRFPELYRHYHQDGVELICIASAFTCETGLAHWHTLVRARAIENQAYVVACAQVGENDQGRKTYGHSLVVDPWGKVIVDLGERVNEFEVVEIYKEEVFSTRQRMNVSP